MQALTRWIAPAALAAALGAGALVPTPARASDDLVQVIVDIADVVFRSGHPYYRYGDYDRGDRLVVRYDRYGRPIYYRYVPREVYRAGPPYGNAYGYHRNRDLRERRICDGRGRCRVEYYDPRYDRRGDWSHRDDDRRWRGRDRDWDDRRWDD